MGVYDPIHQITMWEENFRSSGNLSASTLLIDEVDMKLDNQVQLCQKNALVFVFVLFGNKNAYFPH